MTDGNNAGVVGVADAAITPGRPALSPYLTAPIVPTKGRLDRPSNDDLVKMIAMRMRWVSNYYPEPFTDFIQANRPRGSENVHVFVVAKDKPLTFTDDWSLFPSDGLITQLRLLEEA
jgi:hypothetical protein